MENRTDHRLFILSLWIKGIDSLLEIAGGVALLFAGRVLGFVRYLVDSELIEDPTDFTARHIKQLLPFLWGHSPLFGAIYLLSHGIIKTFLIIALLRQKLWAYPVALFTFGLFIVYQLYRFTHTHSPFLIALSFFDAVVLVLMWREYKSIRRHKGL